MHDSQLPKLPPDLQARLDAAGVTDAASLSRRLMLILGCGATSRHFWKRTRSSSPRR